MSGRKSPNGRMVLATALALHGLAAIPDDTDKFRTGGEIDAFTLYEAGKFNEAVLKLRPLAEQGNVRAQLYLATLYRTGMGVKEDEYEAAKWYGAAARAGIAEAQFHLGLMYLEGVGVTEDTDEALEWMSKASRQGFGEAVDVFQYILNNDEVLNC